MYQQVITAINQLKFNITLSTLTLINHIYVKTNSTFSFIIMSLFVFSYIASDNFIHYNGYMIPHGSAQRYGDKSN